MAFIGTAKAFGRIPCVPRLYNIQSYIGFLPIKEIKPIFLTGKEVQGDGR